MFLNQMSQSLMNQTNLMYQHHVVTTRIRSIRQLQSQQITGRTTMLLMVKMVTTTTSALMVKALQDQMAKLLCQTVKYLTATAM